MLLFLLYVYEKMKDLTEILFMSMFHLHDAAMKAAVVRGGIAGYSWS